MIWSKFIQPRLISLACTSKPIRRQRAKVIPKADGTVLEIGFGSGPVSYTHLTLPTNREV